MQVVQVELIRCGMTFTANVIRWLLTLRFLVDKSNSLIEL